MGNKITIIGNKPRKKKKLERTDEQKLILRDTLRRQQNLSILPVNKPSNLLGLPPEVVTNIFSFLPVPAFLNTFLVCKIWRQICLEFHSEITSMTPWRSISLTKPALHGHTATLWTSPKKKKKKIYIYGGCGPNGLNNTLYIYDFEIQELIPKVIKEGPRAFSHTASLVNGFLYVFGGSNGQNTYTNDLHRIDLSTFTCTLVETTGTKPPARAYHCDTVINDKIFIFGGQRTQYKKSDKNRPEWYNDLHIFDTKTSEWTKMENLKGNPPPPSGAGRMCLYGKKMIHFGGGQWKKWVDYPVDIEYYNNVYQLDIETWTWEKLSDIRKDTTFPGPRAGSSIAVIEDSLLVCGGYYTTGPDWPTYRDCFLLNLETLTWIKLENLPKKTGNHTMVIDGNTVYIIGGIDYTGNDYTYADAVYTAVLNETTAV